MKALIIYYIFYVSASYSKVLHHVYINLLKIYLIIQAIHSNC